MGKIGSYEYPEIQFGTLLKAVEILITKFNGQVNDEKTFAESLGHATNKSGGFLTKLADLRRYGLIDKRGIIATTRAKKIINYLTPMERNQELNECVMEIRLWKDLYNRLGTASPSPNDFKIQLAELTGDRDTSISMNDKIRNLYIDVMNNYTGEAVKEVSNIGVMGDKLPQEQQKKPLEQTKVSENLIVLKSGEVDIQLPKNDTNISILMNVLKGMKENQNE